MAPVEVRLVLSALSEEARRIKERREIESQGLGGWIAIDVVTPKVVDDALGWAKGEIKGHIHNGKPPRAVALYLIMNVGRDCLASGRFHVYRGTLSMQGDGLRAINAYCLDELINLGQFPAEDKIAAIRATDEDINAVG